MSRKVDHILKRRDKQTDKEERYEQTNIEQSLLRTVDRRILQQRDRQTDRQQTNREIKVCLSRTDRQKDKQTNKQTDTKMDKVGLVVGEEWLRECDRLPKFEKRVSCILGN